MRTKDLKIGEKYIGETSWKGAYGVELELVKLGESGRHTFRYVESGNSVEVESRYILGQADEVRAEKEQRQKEKEQRQAEFRAKLKRNKAAWRAVAAELDRVGLGGLLNNHDRNWMEHGIGSSYPRELSLGTEALEQLAAVLAKASV